MAASTPRDIALAFTRAWTSRDLDEARTYLADNVVFDGPLAKLEGADDYIKGLTGLAQAVTGFKEIASYGDDQQALLMYDLITQPFGTLTCAKLLTVRDSKITYDKLTFDSHLIRKVKG